jgi:23S rRNA (uracil1939-C5)-methyltransferase
MKTIPSQKFTIQHIDALGQGVSKDQGKVTFIAKTLPGEEVIARIYRSKGKVVQFAHLEEIVRPSPLRQQALCPHYSQCGGCDFLHTDYKTESQLKFEAYSRDLLKQFNATPILTIPAEKRLGYRNRIQLHYDLKTSKLGFFQKAGHQIVQAPECLIGTKSLQTGLKELYRDKHWKTLLQDRPRSGHIEIYQRDEMIKTSINSPYASGGFTQVNRDMNKKLKDFLHEMIHRVSPKKILDLFGGDGNLSAEAEVETIVVDGFESKKSWPPHQTFFKANLFKDKDLEKLTRHIAPASGMLLMVDPPRSGFKGLNEVTNHFSPEYLIYVSCHIHTMIRDLKSIQNFRPESFHLFDLFPATHHLECVAILRKV